MNLDEFNLDGFGLEHLLFVDRQCRKCLRSLSLIDNFYLTRKDKGSVPSAYSYECKQCTIKRISRTERNARKSKALQQNIPGQEVYPDW